MAYQPIEECNFTQKINAICAKLDQEPKNKKKKPTITLEEAIQKTQSSLRSYDNNVQLDSIRERQFQEIKNDMVDAIINSQGRALYACGLPGTGKTIVINKMLKALHLQFPCDDKFRKVFVQGTVVDSQYLYMTIAIQLNIHTDDIQSSKNNIKDRVMRVLGNKNSKSKKPIPITILYIQDIDLAPYEDIRILMDLSAEQGSKLIIIGTGVNPSFILELRLLSMPLLVVFEEFTQDQITNILTNYIHGDIVHPNAINLIGMKLLRNVHGSGKIAIQLLLESLEHSINIETQKNSRFWEGKDAY